MIDSNSYAEFILGLFKAQFNDCALQYPALSKEFDRDYSRLSSAVESHGIRFVLDVMPSYRKHFDKCLAKERLTLSHLPHFGSWKKGFVIPRFLRGITMRVFDLKGDLKPDPDLQAIRLIRQLLGVARRLRVSCDSRATNAAVKEFIRTDLEVKLGDLDWSTNFDPEELYKWDGSFTQPYYEQTPLGQGTFSLFEVDSLPYAQGQCIQQVADRIASCLGLFDPAEVRFRHGPGAVSDHVFGHHKYDFDNWPDRLDEVFPMADFAVANYDQWVDSTLYKTPDAELRKEHPAKLLAVPKTIKTPRLIASEPTSLQWCQQAIRDFLYNGVARSPFSPFIDFRRQELNGVLALRASLRGSHCTIDLSSASDRISCWHVERLFRRSPSLLNALRATRSLYIEQEISRRFAKHHVLRKFSTMGNATTFPVQSIFFLAVVLGTVHFVRGIRVTARSIAELGNMEVRVFGDDIVVPNDCAGSTIVALSALGLRVNPDKTFVTGRFRESCGVDAFGGEDVTTVSVLDVPKRAKPGSVVSSVDVQRNFATRGYVKTAAFIRRTVERFKAFKLRTVKDGSGSFGWYHDFEDDPTSLPTRWNRNLQIMEVRCLTQANKADSVPAEGGAALLQFFTEQQKVVTTSKSSLTYPRQRAKSSLRLSWVPL